MSEPQEAPESVDVILAEMAHDGSPWGKLRDEYIARLQAAIEWERKALLEVAAELSMMPDGLIPVHRWAARIREIVG